jgi:hypothetical protein
MIASRSIAISRSLREPVRGTARRRSLPAAEARSPGVARSRSNVMRALGVTVALCVRDVDVDRRRVRIARAAADVNGRRVEGPTKTGSSRTLVAPSAVVSVLARHLR